MEELNMIKPFFWGMLVFLLIAFLMNLYFLSSMKEVIAICKWTLFSKNYTNIEATILERKIIQKPVSVPGKNPQRTGTANLRIGRYCPVITVSFLYNGTTYKYDLSLKKKGYDSPEDAINTLYKITNGGSIKFIHTYSKYIKSEHTSFLENFRVPSTDPNSNLTIKINPDNPKENEYQYKDLEFTKLFLGSLFLLIFVVITICVPLFLFNPIRLSTRWIFALCTIVLSVFFHYAVTPKVIKALESTGKFQFGEMPGSDFFDITLDKNYNGSQLRKYFLND